MTKMTDLYRGAVRLQLRLEQWPAIDQELWRQATEAGDILSSAGAGAEWAAGTRKSVIKGYGRWLAWLSRTELLESMQAPASRVTPTCVAAYVAYLREDQSSTTVWSHMNSLAMTLMVMEPAVDIDWLWAIVRRLHRVMVPSRRKADRVVPVSKLYQFGFELMDQASLEPISLQRARLFRNGLLIALLAARPIRIRNLRSIVIDEHLIRSNGLFYLKFEAHETKTHKTLEFALPQRLAARIETYISTFRPILLARRRPDISGTGSGVADTLWISQFGTSMTDCSIYDAIVDATRKQFGRHINPHLFRDCAATSIAFEDPEHVQITTSILGHATLSTSERYYNHALSVKAASMHQGEIAAMRKEFHQNACLTKSL
jgi:integrase/recombinase XerD